MWPQGVGGGEAVVTEPPTQCFLSRPWAPGVGVSACAGVSTLII